MAKINNDRVPLSGRDTLRYSYTPGPGYTVRSGSTKIQDRVPSTSRSTKVKTDGSPSFSTSGWMSGNKAKTTKPAVKTVTKNKNPVTINVPGGGTKAKPTSKATTPSKTPTRSGGTGVTTGKTTGTSATRAGTGGRTSNAGSTSFSRAESARASRGVGGK